MADDPHVATVKSRLDPRLDQPFFETVEHGCTHKNHGFTLDVNLRTARCKGCMAVVDPFEALLVYAHSEKRLVNTKRAIEEARNREARANIRKAERRRKQRQDALNV